MSTLSSLLNEIEQQAFYSEVVSKNVSAGSVGWHISHTLITLQVIIEALRTSNPDDYQWKFNWRRTLIYSINRIPRGKVRAPKIVQPKQLADRETLQLMIEQTREKLKVLEELSSNHYFTHPFFGKLNLRPAKKFLVIHTRHHLNIIKDIVQANKTTAAYKQNA